jgi:parvulin-like peptidyl-prolyl isomerase
VDAEAFPVRRGTMRPEMDKAAFELKEGEVSEVFDVAQSLMFFKVASRKVRELSDVSSQIGNTLQKQKVNSAVDDLKKNAKVWLDDGYFATPVQPGAQGAAKPQVLPGGPPTPK